MIRSRLRRSWRLPLWVKMALVLFGISWLSILFLMLVFRQFTIRAFEQYLLERARPVLTQAFIHYYWTHNTWEGVDRNFRERMGENMVGKALPLRTIALRLYDAERRLILEEGYFTRTSHTEQVTLTLDNKVIGFLEIQVHAQDILPDSPEGRLLQRLHRVAWWSALTAGALAILGAVLWARWLTRPIRKLADALHQVERGALGLQLPPGPNDELGDLIAAFNRMSRALAQTHEVRQQMTADIAHELSTPLSVLLGYAEALAEGSIQPSEDLYELVHQQVQHLHRLVADLRLLSLADAKELPLQRQPVRLPKVLEEILAQHQAEADRQGVRLAMDVSPNLPPLDADPERLRHVLENLITTAVRRTPKNGRVTVRAWSERGYAYFVVEDSGSNLPPHLLERIFERFYRAPSQERVGSGLSLAIVRALVQAHGGRIWAENRPQGGIRFVIEWPLWATGKEKRGA